MRNPTASKHLQGVTDLTLLAPIKQGFVPALDTCTYATRIRRLLQTLHTLRTSSREFARFAPFSDTVDRIQSIHSLRIAILEPERKLLLSVAYDHGSEPYIRDIWRILGTLVDVIFCNCEGYVSAYHNTYEGFATWVGQSQIDTNFFHNESSFSVGDLQYLTKTEKIFREGRDLSASDFQAARLGIYGPEEGALKAGKSDLHETGNMGLAALAALYRLTDVYPAQREDGGYLLRATHCLLQELHQLDTKVLFPPGSDKRERYASQLAWFEQDIQVPTFDHPEKPTEISGRIQRGVLTNWGADGLPMTHGCLLLMQITDANAARQLLERLEVAAEGALPPGDGIYLNVAFTYAGLKTLGVPQASLDKFPKDFQEGMEQRAGILGDVRSNHPRNWKLPERNWPDAHAGKGIVQRVQLSAVDIVIQLRVKKPSIQSGDFEICGNRAHPLYARVAELGGFEGLRILSVQPMLAYGLDASGTAVDHFGFCDGISQPTVAERGVRRYWSDNVKLGDVLYGGATNRGDPIKSDGGEFLTDGTFMVVRKLRQDVKTLHEVLDAQVDAVRREHPQIAIDRSGLLAKMMGRESSGKPLVGVVGDDINDFNYESDKEGGKCPFHSHIRRANPRVAKHGKAVPRIVRRSMSYGPPYPAASDDSNRGLMFIAYNSSISEQFEVIQQWISGGISSVNSSGVFSGQSDPFLGVPQAGDPRTFRFVHEDKVIRVDLQAPDARSFVELEWGAYLYVPPVQAIRAIASLPVFSQPDEADVGEEIIRKLEAMEENQAGVEWKTCLEDVTAREDGDTAAVWSAIRKYHSGVLRTPYGILVGTSSLVAEVFRNAVGRYSVSGYLDRMRRSIGEIYLGLDEGEAYRKWSKDTNNAILSVGEREAFEVTYSKTALFLEFLLEGAKDDSDAREVPIDLKRDLSDLVLSVLSFHWFGLPDDLPDGPFVTSGGWDWDSWDAGRVPRCPGDFTPPSRYLFSPNPGPAASEYGERAGQTLREAVHKFVRKVRESDIEPNGRLLKAMLDAIPDSDQAARTIVGVMMGFLPTVDGSLRSTLYEWLKEKTLWRIQEELIGCRASGAYERACEVLKQPIIHAMQRRPVPNLVWRTAVQSHLLGNVGVSPGDVVVIGIESATREDQFNGVPTVFPVFGGDRSSADHPTHACPAYKMSMGILMGAICALLEAGTISPTPAPLTVILTGRFHDSVDEP